MKIVTAAQDKAPTKQEALATSADWLAVILNVLPDLDSENLNQRRWKAHWITSERATTFIAPGAIPRRGAETAEEMNNQLVGLGGLVALAEGTAVEAGLDSEESLSSGVSQLSTQQAIRRKKGHGDTESLLQRGRGGQKYSPIVKRNGPREEIRGFIP